MHIIESENIKVLRAKLGRVTIIILIYYNYCMSNCRKKLTQSQLEFICRISVRLDLELIIHATLRN